jgi:hypothetical protein
MTEAIVNNTTGAVVPESAAPFNDNEANLSNEQLNENEHALSLNENVESAPVDESPDKVVSPTVTITKLLLSSDGMDHQVKTLFEAAGFPVEKMKNSSVLVNGTYLHELRPVMYQGSVTEVDEGSSVTFTYTALASAPKVTAEMVDARYREDHRLTQPVPSTPIANTVGTSASVVTTNPVLPVGMPPVTVPESPYTPSAQPIPVARATDQAEERSELERVGPVSAPSVPSIPSAPAPEHQ